MITLHNAVLRFNKSFNRWYTYTDSGLLIYLDFTVVKDADKLVSGSAYTFKGKVMPSPKTGEGCPIFILFVLGYEASAT